MNNKTTKQLPKSNYNLEEREAAGQPARRSRASKFLISSWSWIRSYWKEVIMLIITIIVFDTLSYGGVGLVFVLYFVVISGYRIIKGWDQFILIIERIETMLYGKPASKEYWAPGEWKHRRRLKINWRLNEMKEKIKAKFSDGRFAASLIIISAICLFAGFMTQMTYAFLGSLWLMISGCTLLICSVVEKAVKDLKKEAHDEDH